MQYGKRLGKANGDINCHTCWNAYKEKVQILWYEPQTDDAGI